jgi:hypothetical protein
MFQDHIYPQFEINLNPKAPAQKPADLLTKVFLLNNLADNL